MVCAVREIPSGRLLPACSHPAAEGMEIDASSPEVRAARRDILELLFSEHVGDCEAPCRRACPAGLRIPEMLRDAERSDWPGAAALAANDLILPATLGWICPAPCQKSCRRAQHDCALAIRETHRRLGERAVVPRVWPPAGPWRVAIIGAGPAGLATAVELRRVGVLPVLHDRAASPSGALRSAIPKERLPRGVLEAELASALPPDLEFHGGVEIVTASDFDALAGVAAAVLVACGRLPARRPEAWGLRGTERGIVVDPATRQTSRSNVYAAGDAVQTSRLAVRAIADGRTAARAIARMLRGEPAAAPRPRFDSRIGRIEPAELAQWAVGAASDRPELPAAAVGAPLDGEVSAEAARCFDCDCRKAATCRLRRYADEYEADAGRYRAMSRFTVEIRRDHPAVVYEPGKCIKCAICVRLAAGAGDATMSVERRGYEERIAPAFADGLEAGLGGVAAECVAACPTAALAWRDRWEPSSPP